MTYVIDRQSQETYQDAFDEAYQKGYKAGYQEGYEEGYKIGQKDARTEIAQRMLQAGMEPERIAHFTGLSLEELANLEPNE